MASKELLEEIRRRLSIVSFVGERIPLKKSGRNFKGLCPFHQEKTSSFMVNEEKQIFHCFGCASGGDIFTFLMKIDGLTFPEALQELAKKAGVKLPTLLKKEDSEANEEWARRKAWGFRVNEIAQKHFLQNLNDPTLGKNARNYLQSRGINLETAKQHFLGVADKEWESLVTLFKEAKAPLKLVLELGLIKEREKEGGYYDFFRERLMFPILDIQGKVIGFSGRMLGTTEGAKYLNSSDSLIYNKSRSLFGLYWAKDAIRTQDEVILVEGNLDLIALRQAGVENVVAPLGTALTKEHLELLMRYTRNFIIAFDGDKAGQQSAFRALPVFLDLGLTPKALILPTGEDPDSFVRKEGKTGWDHLKQRALTLFEYFMECVFREAGKGTAAQVHAWEKIRPMLEKVANPLEQNIYKKQIGEKLGVALPNLKKSHGQWTMNNESKAKPATPYPEEEKLLIAAMVLKPKVLKMIQNAGDIFTDPRLKKTAEILFQQYKDEGDISISTLPSEMDPQLAGWIREIALREDGETIWERAATDCLSKIKGKNLGLQLSQLNQEIKTAESQGDEAVIEKLLIEKTKLIGTKRGI